MQQYEVITLHENIADVVTDFQAMLQDVSRPYHISQSATRLWAGIMHQTASPLYNQPCKHYAVHPSPLVEGALELVLHKNTHQAVHVVKHLNAAYALEGKECAWLQSQSPQRAEILLHPALMNLEAVRQDFQRDMASLHRHIPGILEEYQMEEGSRSYSSEELSEILRRTNRRFAALIQATEENWPIERVVQECMHDMNRSPFKFRPGFKSLNETVDFGQLAQIARAGQNEQWHAALAAIQTLQQNIDRNEKHTHIPEIVGWLEYAEILAKSRIGRDVNIAPYRAIQDKIEQLAGAIQNYRHNEIPELTRHCRNLWLALSKDHLEDSLLSRALREAEDMLVAPRAAALASNGHTHGNHPGTWLNDLLRQQQATDISATQSSRLNL